MIHAEMISVNSVLPVFHLCAEQLTGKNPATIVQIGKKPRGNQLMILAYLRAFHDPLGDTSQVRSFAGFLHVGMMCAGPDIELAEVTGWPHGLRCLACEVGRTGLTGVVFAGDGEQWNAAIRGACMGPPPVVEWGMNCYRQFGKFNMADIIGVLKIQGPSYTVIE